MKLPELVGTVERRLLVNYRVDPDVLGALLPEPFRPQLVNGYAVAGICLIRLGSMRPAGLPARIGLTSESAAHRMAVQWDSPDGLQSGVYIPRRDTDSMINVAVGGRIYPGVLHRARFEVAESDDDLRVAFAARDGSATVRVEVRVTDNLAGSRLFADTAAASAFFEGGSVGFSDTRHPSRFDGLALHTTAWHVEPGIAVTAESSFFADRARFPEGSAELDCALVMRQIPVRWRPLASLQAPAAPATGVSAG
ncbi:MAG TPA: DUF2071 domain-containing protein [Jatrophihabitans sp.]|jgi:hypothetical protein|nr:DUF2071 domain-containing protein [Jatrophihabitans sp.]